MSRPQDSAVDGLYDKSVIIRQENIYFSVERGINGRIRADGERSLTVAAVLSFGSTVASLVGDEQ